MGKVLENESGAMAGNVEHNKAAEGSAKDSVSELLPFFSHQRPELRKAAADLVLQLTGTESGQKQLKDAGVIRHLCRLAGDLHNVSEPAIKALINLSCDEEAAEEMLEYGILNKIISALSNKETSGKSLSLSLLANLTTLERGAEKALQVEDERLRGLYMRRLMRWFTEERPQAQGYQPLEEYTEEDSFQYVANVLANISRTSYGRDLLQSLGIEPLWLLLEEIDSPNPVRRRGVAATIKNWCFDESCHEYLLNKVDVVGFLLFPLAGPEALSDDDEDGLSPRVTRLGDKKRREPDAGIRKILVESLLLFCTSREGRNELRKRKVYPIVRDADSAETDEEVSEEIYKLVNMLMRDEEGEEPDWNEIRSKAFADGQEGDVQEVEQEEGESDDDDLDDLPDLVGGLSTESNAGAERSAQQTAHTSWQQKKEKSVDVQELD